MSKQKNTKIKGATLSPKQLKVEIAKMLAAKKNKRYTTKQVLKKLKVNNSRQAIQEALDTLIEEGVVYHSNNQYKWDIKSSVKDQAQVFPSKEYEGRVDLTRSGDGYIIVDDLEDDVYVPRKFLKGAMNKDRVKISVPKIPGKRRPEGRVLEIVKRAITHAIGKITLGDNYSTLEPIQKALGDEIFIHNNALNGLLNGEYAVVEITDWGQSQNKGIWGKVIKKLEKASEIDLAMQSIFLSHGFELEFPPEVWNELKHIELDINEAEVARRRDFRDVLTFTIDPASAKDFDDAISFRALGNDTFEVGVHIADVTHYLKEGSALDQEALKRTTSVYLVDRVLPMLPEKLSNDLCSLNPNEDRYTFSAVFIFDGKYNVIDEWFGRTVIHSDRRYTYEDAQEVLETGEGDYAKELLKINEVAHKLRKEKFKNGAISFESEEIKFELGPDGKPVDVIVKDRKDAHMLIEDFMLLANRSVAKFIATKTKREIPYIYRVHDLPNEEKLADFALFAKELGFTMNLKTPRQIAVSFNELQKAAEHDDTLELLTPLAIRTMAKAVYTTENIGHYGLGFEYYTHFTSPIRRYADVLVHRILDKNLGDVHRVEKSDLEAKAKHISTKEKQAAEAERESIKYFQTLYISEHIGEVMNGMVSGMIEKGFFVALEGSRAEGLIEFKTLDEHYTMESRFKATSKSGHTIQMGHEVVVEILAIDMDKRQIEMRLLEFKN